MFLKKMSRPLSKIPVSIRVTVWFTAVIIFLFSIVLSSVILLEDRYINNTSTEELVSAVEKIYEDPDEFENFNDGIYYIKYNENNEIIAGKIPKDFDLTLAFSIEDINTYQIENKKFLYYDTRLKNTGDWIRGIYPLSRFQNDISKMWDILFYYIAPLFIAFVAFVGYKIVKNAFKPVKKISETALEIKKSKNFSRRIELDNSEDEIHKMASAFNEMLDTVEETFIHEKQFSSDVSHELRTPLTSIKGWSETLGLDNISKEELSMGLGIINDETERLIKLVEELLDFSRMSSNRMKLDIGEVNIENLVASVVNQLRSMAIKKNIRLSFEFLNQDMTIIYGDKDRLRQVLINLVQNSIKFTPEEGIISVKVGQNSNETSICVADNGIGIDEKNIANVSKKFFQEDFHKSGSGLGLAISEEIVKLHGGSLTINSKKNIGTQITVNISNDSRKA